MVEIAPEVHGVARQYFRLPDEDEHDYNTAAGMVVAHFGRIPAPGEYFDYENWRIEVVDLDGARIDKLLIQQLPDRADNDD